MMHTRINFVRNDFEGVLVAKVCFKDKPQIVICCMSFPVQVLLSWTSPLRFSCRPPCLWEESWPLSLITVFQVSLKGHTHTPIFIG